MAKIYLLGTSHIAQDSVKAVERAVEQLKPNIIAIELDRERLFALQTGERGKPRLRDIRRIGVKGWLFAQLGSYVERKLGQKVGVSPGSEMIKAVEMAKKHKLKVALIDRPIQITLKHLSRKITWKEKWRFLVDIVKGVVRPKSMPFDVRGVPGPEMIAKLLKELKPRYPSVYHVLVEERNNYMADRLKRIVKAEDVVLVIVGAGHIEGMQELLTATI